MRPLTPGEIGVSFLPSGRVEPTCSPLPCIPHPTLHSGRKEILPESEFTLVDRSLHPGDVCKRSFDDVRSGIVVNAESTFRLFHAISGTFIPQRVSFRDVVPSIKFVVGDFVIYDNWVGQVRSYSS